MKVFLAGRIAVEAEGSVIDERHFPGRQGRLLFAYLVSEQGRPVPRDEIADVLWGDSPPATWDKALSVLVSKLRGVLAESGVDGAEALTAAFGCYQLDLPNGTWVDVLAAESAATEAEKFLETDEPARATAAAALAESVARSPFLPGDDGPWVEEKRRELAEVRARALTALAEASLRTDRAEEAVRWAGLAVEAEPFRESGYRRLMEAHVAAGNRGEALRVYERCRQLLAEELGAYPSPETESVYRTLLEAPPGRAAAETDLSSAPESAPPPASRRNRPVLGAVVLVVLVTLVAAGAAIVVVAAHDDKSKASPLPPRVALVVPKSPAGSDDPSAQYVDALNRARTEDGASTQVLPIDLKKPLSAHVRKTIGNVDLVLLAGQFVGAKFVREFARNPRTRFVVLDPDPINGSLFDAVSRAPNASDVFFIEGPGAYLAGSLAALTAERQDPGKRPVVSEILINRNVSSNVGAPFISGARAAVRNVKVLRDYAGKSSTLSVCERIASDEIKRGSRVVYADAGACSAGALSVAEALRVWGIAADRDPSNLDRDQGILGSTEKNFGQEVAYAIHSYGDGTLGNYHHLDIGIEHNAVDLSLNPVVPEGIRTKVVGVRLSHLKKWAAEYKTR